MKSKKKVKFNDESYTDVLNQNTVENLKPKPLTKKFSKVSSLSNINEIVKPTTCINSDFDSFINNKTPLKNIKSADLMSDLLTSKKKR